MSAQYGHFSTVDSTLTHHRDHDVVWDDDAQWWRHLSHPTSDPGLCPLAPRDVEIRAGLSPATLCDQRSFEADIEVQS